MDWKKASTETIYALTERIAKKSQEPNNTFTKIKRIWYRGKEEEEMTRDIYWPQKLLNVARIDDQLSFLNVSEDKAVDIFHWGSSISTEVLLLLPQFLQL